jgi:hypothetical protein
MSFVGCGGKAKRGFNDNFLSRQSGPTSDPARSLFERLRRLIGRVLEPLVTLATLAVHDDRYTATLAIPFFSLAMAWLERKNIFLEVGYAPGPGIGLALCALGIFAISRQSILSLRIFALLIV